MHGDYKIFIVRLEKLAEEEVFDIFAVRSEYACTLANDAARWFSIAKVRKVFSRKITYVAIMTRT